MKNDRNDTARRGRDETDETEAVLDVIAMLHLRLYGLCVCVPVCWLLRFFEFHRPRLCNPYKVLFLNLYEYSRFNEIKTEDGYAFCT